MDENDARTRLMEVGLSEDQINEVLPFIVQPKQQPAVSSGLSAAITSLEQSLVDEPDWRKRAATAARIISLRLDT